MITVAVYMYDRAYGGPEEGGWWYDTYTPMHEEEEFVHLLAHFPSTEEGEIHAERWEQLAQKYLDKEYNEYRTPVSSVNSDGKYVVLATDGYDVTHIPHTRPHYE